ncbi:MAG: acyl-CoA dehydratase activase [Myxococcales bacterium]
MPDFESVPHALYSPAGVPGAAPVEIDRYASPAEGTLRAWLGIDIGSTSTKAVLVSADGPLPERGSTSDRVLAGFYTRTAGRPVAAVQALFEAIEHWARSQSAELSIAGAATTGSGRKLAGGIVGADLVVDEITAHARAACQLAPEVDTIIEIGGQDAKFTALKDGGVTLSIMNNVCAAGTGSFIEEQANRLGCQVQECAARAAGRPAPLSSDCCTVFMERDLNHFLAQGYAVEEVLAASLHSVCENYLRKVARESLIGSHVWFQGATAKNRSLVAAFEQRLAKPVHVSRYCHLTGALGAALLVAESAPQATGFRGLALCREAIPVRTEVCKLCRNHCKLTVSTVRDETVAFGMLCGREYESERYESANRSGFDLLAAMRRHFARPPATPRLPITIGLPAALYLAEDLPLWQRFFDLIGVRTVTGEGRRDAARSGKRLQGAELCAPMAAFHGQVAALGRECDFVFAPFYIEDGPRPDPVRRNYCYYSQFAGSLAATIPDAALRAKLLTPVVSNRESISTKAGALHEALAPALGGAVSRREIEQALVDARRWMAERRAALPAVMREARADGSELAVVLLGRPYTVLSASMNKSIPELIAAQGVKCFSQAMLEVKPEDLAAIEPLLTSVHWAFASQMLAAAQVVGRSPGLYPVVVTSFKCAPDSCVLESLRRIFDSHGKPFLILQLDEHDSQVGYETRIEAALRSFRSHHGQPQARPKASLPVNPAKLERMDGKTVLLPRWDRYSCALMAANMRREGIDARVLDEDELLITRALRHNTGQCLPLSVITEGFISYVDRHGIDPGRAALWIHSSQIGCNIGAFPLAIQSLLEAQGRGFERSRVYVGQISGQDISMRAVANQYLAFLCAGYLRRLGCRVRPYEVHAGETDRVLEAGLAELTDVFENGRDVLAAFRRLVDRLLAVETKGERRPKVALFGDFYVRDNDVLNQAAIAHIEAEGGEVITTPYTEYTKIIADAYLRKWIREGKYKQAAQGQLVLSGAKLLERGVLREAERILGPRPAIKQRPVAEILAPYRVTPQHTGESFDNLLKIHHLLEEHPDIALFVQLSPSFCCPSLVTEAMTREIRKVTGVPVVTVTYDGTRTRKNGVVTPYLRFLRERGRGAAPQRQAGDQARIQARAGA